jgi:hypothetical protein
MHFDYGWGWTIKTLGKHLAEFSEIAIVNQTEAAVIPSEFFADGGATTRGFLGRIVQPGHTLHDLPVLAFTMSDGFDYDFASNICPVWRFFLGDGELVCPAGSFPRLHGPRIIGGYGNVKAQSSIAKCA